MLFALLVGAGLLHKKGESFDSPFLFIYEVGDL